MEFSRLDQLKEGEQAKVVRLDSSGSIRRRLQDIGLVPGSYIKCLLKSPLGDPVAYDICGAVIALRKEETDKIYVTKGVNNGSY
ncbi:hypothetical protein IMSAG049_00682 [Clostridiales bacterium]|nr:hypothetical protein IMSAG049_00682 [Clostridiales bacterium]